MKGKNLYLLTLRPSEIGKRKRDGATLVALRTRFISPIESLGQLAYSGATKLLSKQAVARGLDAHPLEQMAAHSPPTIDEAISGARIATILTGSYTLTLSRTKLGSTRSMS